MRAKVELTGAQSLTIKGRTFLKGVQQILTDPHEIAYCETRRDIFAVDVEEGTPKKVKALEPPSPPDDEEGDEITDVQLDAADEDEEAPASKLNAAKSPKPVKGRR